MRKFRSMESEDRSSTRAARPSGHSLWERSSGWTRTTPPWMARRVTGVELAIGRACVRDPVVHSFPSPKPVGSSCDLQ